MAIKMNTADFRPSLTAVLQLPSSNRSNKMTFEKVIFGRPIVSKLSAHSVSKTLKPFVVVVVVVIVFTFPYLIDFEI